MQACRDASVLEDEHRLDQTGQPGRGFKVAQVCLDRADHQRRVGGAVLAKRLRQRMRLERIADGRARAMRLDESHRQLESTPASTQASLTSRACASALGSEMPLVWPSWFSAVPTMTP